MAAQILPQDRKPNRAAIYARVSTSNHGQDVGMQTRELRQFAEARGWQVTGEYLDEGISGAKDSRPELNRLMNDARQRKLDAILVWKLDRFGRSLKHLVTAIADLESLGVAFVALKDNLDLSTPSGRLMFHVIGAMAEFERALIQERVKSGIKNARAKGTRLGRPVILNGWHHAEVARLRATGLSGRAIARQLNISEGSVRRMASAVA